MSPQRALTPADLLEPFAGRIARQAYGATTPIDGVKLEELRVHRGTDSAFCELLRVESDGNAQHLGEFAPRQWNWSLLEPGAVKAWHLHLAQTDLWLVPPDSQMLIGLVDLRRGSPTSQSRMRLALGGGCCHRLLIPRGVAHGVANLTNAPRVILYATDCHFSPDPQASDEWRLPADTFGDDFWQMDRN